MSGYKNGKIYKLTCSETDKVYIGSTTLTLKQRLAVHKQTKASMCCSTKDFINPKIELIESYPCETKEQLLWKEREYMEKTDCVNIHRPIRTNEEKKEQSKRAIKAYKQRNPEIERERTHKKHECLCGGIYTIAHRTRHLRTKKHLNYVSSKE